LGFHFKTFHMVIDWDCIRDSLMEILGIGGITMIIAYLRTSGMEALATTAFKRLLERVLKGFLKKGASRVIPWIGLALIILDIIIMIKDCIQW
jgi:hypothetical protein